MLYLLPLLFITTWIWVEPQDLHWYLLPMGSAVLLWDAIKKECSVQWNIWSIFVFAYALWILIQMNPDAEYSPRQTVFAFTLMIVTLLLGRESLNRVKIAILASGSLIWNLWYLGLKVCGREPEFYWNGPFNQENHLQFMNSIAMVGLIWVLMAHKELVSKWLRNIVFVALGCGILSLLFSGAKNAVIGAFVSIVLVFGRLLVRSWKKRASLWSVILVSVLLLIVFEVALPLFLGALPKLSGLGDSLTSRQTIWNATFQLIRNHWGFGAGPGCYGAEIMHYWPDLQNAAYQASYFPAGPHNVFLHSWAELGLLGLSFWISIYALALGYSLRRWLEPHEKFDFILFPVLAGVLVQLGLIFTTQWHISSMLLAVLIPGWVLYQVQAKGWQIRKPFIVAMLAIVPTILLGFAFVPYTRWAHSESVMKDIVVSHKVSGNHDVQKIQKSLSIWPNSAALYYGARVYIENGDFDVAWKMTDDIERVSGARWPIAKLRALIKYKAGDCESGDAYGEIERRIHLPSDLADMQKAAAECWNRRKR